MPLQMVLYVVHSEHSQVEKFGDKRVRTAGLTGAIRALYQLSYIPAG